MSHEYEEYLLHLANIKRNGKLASFDGWSGEPILEEDKKRAEEYILSNRLAFVSNGKFVLTSRGKSALR